MGAHRNVWIVTALAVGVLAASFGISVSHAQEGRKRGADAGAPRLKISEIASKLRSGDPAQILEGLELARATGKESALLLPEIEGLLRGGTSLELAKASIITLGELRAPSSTAAVAPYARHRRADLRRTAIEALAKTQGAEAPALLKRALGDADASVRQAAAQGLRALDAKEALDELFIALDRGVHEAAPTLGALCDEASCDRLTASFGALPFEALAGAIEAIWARAEIADSRKLRLLDSLQTIDLSQARDCLQRLRSITKETSVDLHRALDQALADLPADTGAP